MYTLPFIRSFVHSFIRSFVRSFVRSFIRSFVRSFVHSFVRLFVRSFVRPFVRLFVRSPSQPASHLGSQSLRPTASADCAPCTVHRPPLHAPPTPYGSGRANPRTDGRTDGRTANARTHKRTNGGQRAGCCLCLSSTDARTDSLVVVVVVVFFFFFVVVLVVVRALRWEGTDDFKSFLLTLLLPCLEMLT